MNSEVHHILLIKGSHKVSTDSRGEEIRLAESGESHTCMRSENKEPPLETVYHVLSPEIHFLKERTPAREFVPVIHQGHYGGQNP